MGVSGRERGVGVRERRWGAREVLGCEGRWGGVGGRGAVARARRGEGERWCGVG